MVAIAAAGATCSLVEMVRSGLDEGKKNATLALAILAFGNAANKVAVVATGAISPQVELLRDGSDEGKKNAALALSQLAHMNNDAAGALRNLAVQQ